MNTDDKELLERQFDKDDDVDEVTPGSDPDSYDRDPDFDYADQEWGFGEYATGEVRLDSLATDAEYRFPVSEPKSEGDIHTLLLDAAGFERKPRIVAEILIDDGYAPTDEQWAAMTPREKKLLNDRLHDWFKTDQHIDEGALAEELDELLDAETN